MKIQPLYDLQQDINRLFIAGSKFAQNDPRLLKQVPVFNKLGEKAPVFKKLATDIQALTEAPAIESAEKLSALSSLLYSILYTQGETVEEEQEVNEHLPTFKLEEINTSRSYIELAPVIKALTESNSGRLEIVKDAEERGIFNDFRTFQYLDVALGDKYGELAEHVEKIIAKIGKPIIPFLLGSFDYEGRTEDVRRLRLLHKFQHEGLEEMMKKILEEKSVNLQAAAVEILGENQENEALIIQLADDKNKPVREAAFKALAQLGTEKSLEKLKDVYLKNKNKGNLPGIVSAIASSKLPFFFQEIFNQVHSCFEEVIKYTKEDDDKVLTSSLEKFETNLTALTSKNQTEVYDFLSEILLNKSYNALISAKKTLLGRTAQSISYAITECLDSFDSQKQIAFYERIASDMPDCEWKNPIILNYLYLSVQKGYSKEKVFDTFIEKYNKGQISLDNLINAYSDSHVRYYSNTVNIKDPQNSIDKRWVDKIFDDATKCKKIDGRTVQMLRFIDVCEPQKSKRFDELLLKCSVNVEIHTITTIFDIIMKRDVTNKFEHIYSITSKYKKGSGQYYFYSLRVSDIWKEFPKEYVQRYRQLYEKEKLDLYNEIADKIEFEN